MPKVSIIIPVYNAESSVERCIESVLNQDFADIEVIAVNDGSRDGSLAILQRYAAVDPRLSIIDKPNTGVSDSRNQALNAVRGTYVLFVDADDWLVPEAVGALLRAAEASGAGMVICDFYRVVGNRTSRKGSIDEDGLITRGQFADYMARSPADYYYGVLWNKLFRRDIIEQYGLRMDEQLSWCEDFIFNMEYILHIESVYVLRVPLYYYVKTEGGLISKGMNMPDIVRMKLNVIEYYTNFYKNVYSSVDYAAKRPLIYGFLVDFAHDDAAIPGFPGTRKLGEERVLARQQDARIDDLWTWRYYEGRLLDRNLARVAQQTDLDVKDIRLLAYLQHFGAIEDLRELAAYVGVSQLSTVAMLERLALKKLVIMDVTHPSTAKAGEQAEKVFGLIADAVRTTERAIREGWSEDEADTYAALRARAMANMQRRLEV